jgi:HAAS
MDGPIERYLAAFRRRLRLEGPQRGRIVAEVEDHLRESELSVRRRGFAPTDAERLAVRRIGTPDQVAKGMNDEAARVTGLPPRPQVVLAIIGAGLLFVGLLLVLFVAFLWPRDSEQEVDTFIAGEFDEFEVGQPVHFRAQRIWIVRLDDQMVRAYSDKDPRGCTLPFRPDFTFDLGSGERAGPGLFRDPCGGSTYDLAGNRLFGPSPFDMTEYPVRIEEDQVLVALGLPQCGENKGDYPGDCFQLAEAVHRAQIAFCAEHPPECATPE